MPVSITKKTRKGKGTPFSHLQLGFRLYSASDYFAWRGLSRRQGIVFRVCLLSWRYEPLKMIRIAISVEDDILFHKEEDLDVEESRMFCQ